MQTRRRCRARPADGPAGRTRRSGDSVPGLGSRLGEQAQHGLPGRERVQRAPVPASGRSPRCGCGWRRPSPPPRRPAGPAGVRAAWRAARRCGRARGPGGRRRAGCRGRWGTRRTRRRPRWRAAMARRRCPRCGRAPAGGPGAGTPRSGWGRPVLDVGEFGAFVAEPGGPAVGGQRAGGLQGGVQRGLQLGAARRPVPRPGAPGRGRATGRLPRPAASGAVPRSRGRTGRRRRRSPRRRTGGGPRRTRSGWARRCRRGRPTPPGS